MGRQAGRSGPRSWSLSIVEVDCSASERALPNSRPSLFETIVSVPSAEFIACRDHEFKRSTRDALEDAWQRYGHLCPEGDEFVKHFQLEFLARSWELWLIAALSASGLRLECPPATGPDVMVSPLTGPRIWIEAVVPTPGSDNSADRVRQRRPRAEAECDDDDDTWEPDLSTGPRCDQVALRYLSALRDKLEKIKRYRATGIIRDCEACLVALGQGGIVDGDLCDVEIPLLVRAVFGIGSPVLVVPLFGEGEPHGKTPLMSSVSKSNGARVPATQFLDGSAAALSGVLFAANAVWNLEWAASRSLRMVHNPSAMVSLPRGAITTACEMWVDDGVLRHRGRCARFGAYGETS